MERHDSPHVIETVAIGLARHLAHSPQYDREAAEAFLNVLHEHGLAVTERNRTIMEWSPWAVKQVTPGDVRVSQDDGGDHVVVVEATATLVRLPPLGQGPVIERHITIGTKWACGEDAVDRATRNAISLALQQARDAAEGFISAASEAEHEAA
jgi:hypothetical protein